MQDDTDQQPQFTFGPLDPKAPSRKTFTCGKEPLDRYLRQYARQDIESGFATCFTATTSTGEIAGYFTLSSHSIPLGDIPKSLQKGLPRYSAVPSVLLGRLAVSKNFAGKGLGGGLLASAISLVLAQSVASYALVVDALDDEAVEFYKHHGFYTFASAPMKLFIPLAAVRRP